MEISDVVDYMYLASITGFTKALFITDIMIFGWQVKRIIAIFTLDENQYFYHLKSNANEIF